MSTSYEQATDEIDMKVNVNGNELRVLAAFVDPQKPPFEAEKIGIGAYQIVGESGKVIKEGTAESVEIVNGRSVMPIDIGGP